jgi:hypothetical protein
MVYMRICQWIATWDLICSWRTDGICDRLVTCTGHWGTITGRKTSKQLSKQNVEGIRHMMIRPLWLASASDIRAPLPIAPSDLKENHWTW